MIKSNFIRDVVVDKTRKLTYNDFESSLWGGVWKATSSSMWANVGSNVEANVIDPLEYGVHVHVVYATEQYNFKQ